MNYECGNENETDKKVKMKMRTKIISYYPSTLKSFTSSVKLGFSDLGFEFMENNMEPCYCALIQIHGATGTATEDEEILSQMQKLNIPKLLLIHRPDEVLENSKILSFFEENPQTQLLFLGDLVYRFPFWEKRRLNSSVIPHPQLDYSMPSEDQKPIVGSFTSWGEMRNIKHFVSLAESLKSLNLFQFRVGGPGIENTLLPDFIQKSQEYFVPHFNVQLYHLNGKKRYCESSGSLHRGISIPIIFEANGAERLEGIKVIKIESDDNLERIDYEKAALEINDLLRKGISPLLKANLELAKQNSVQSFASKIMDILNA